jgi:hypothetical protein
MLHVLIIGELPVGVGSISGGADVGSPPLSPPPTHGQATAAIIFSGKYTASTPS